MDGLQIFHAQTFQVLLGRLHTRMAKDAREVVGSLRHGDPASRFVALLRAAFWPADVPMSRIGVAVLPQKLNSGPREEARVYMACAMLPSRCPPNGRPYNDSNPAR